MNGATAAQSWPLNFFKKPSLIGVTCSLEVWACDARSAGTRIAIGHGTAENAVRHWRASVQSVERICEPKASFATTAGRVSQLLADGRLRYFERLRWPR